MDNKEIISEFIAETEEHLQILNEKMLLLEKHAKEKQAVSFDDINAMFRATHTIKGTASFLGFPNCVKLSHKTETVFQKLRDREILFNEKLIETLFSSIDTLGEILKAIKEKGADEGVSIESNIAAIELILSAPLPDPTERKDTAREEKAWDKYMDLFISETQQNLEDLNELLLKAEKEREYSPTVDSIFRIAHNTKGSSGMVNVPQIRDISHRMESILSLFRDKRLPLAPGVINVMFKCSDVISGLIAALAKDGVIKADVSNTIEELDKSLALAKSTSVESGLAGNIAPSSLEAKAAAVLSTKERNLLNDAVKSGYSAFFVRAIIAKGIEEKVFKATILEERLKKKGLVIALNPKPDTLSGLSGEEVLISILFASQENKESIKNSLVIDGISDVSVDGYKLTEAEVKPGAYSENVFIRVDAQKLDDLMNLSGELIIIRAQFTRLVQMFQNSLLNQKDYHNSVDQVNSQLNSLKQEAGQLLLKAKDVSEKEQLKFKEALRKAEEALTGLGRKLIDKGAAENIKQLTSSTESLQKIASGLQANVMRTRLVPIEGTFLRFERMVRDLSKKLNKEVDLILVGAETELDKKIVDKIGEPLTHMIRNSIDHGLEDRVTRLKENKPEKGVISLKASNRGNTIWIEISDDGRGIDLTKVSNFAVYKGLITAEQAQKMSEKELLDIVFMPGFSTASNVTDVSGRGVGMDVVKDVVSSLNGTIEVKTNPGLGTTFILKIPLTLSIIDALLVSIGEATYAFPLNCVTEIIQVTEKEIGSIDGFDTVKLRDHTLSLLRLDKIIKLKREAKDYAQEEAIKVVVISDGDSVYGVLVDELIGKEEIVIKPLTRHFSQVKGLSGASLLADGRIVLILDPMSIINEAGK
ncbi:MAG: chemotaxis protein CheA [Candidatus Omnitrophica bacterium]|nr:chemotaxis protein CheA [Candidatus Omnitrophota bacterium]